MLAFELKPDGRFFIGKDICVQLVSVNGNRVRVGVQAPRDLQIMREELLTPADAAARLQAAKGGK